MNRAERTERIRTLSRVALGLARSTLLQGYIEVDGDRFGVYDFAHNEITIEHLRATDEGVLSKLAVRYLGAKMLSVEWTASSVLRTSFKPGEWERQLLRLQLVSTNAMRKRLDVVDRRSRRRA